MPLCFLFLNIDKTRAILARTRRFPKERKRARPFLRLPSICRNLTAFIGMRLVMDPCGRMKIRLA